MRIPIIAGNWKMNKNIHEALELVEGIKTHKLNKGVEAVLFVPFTDLKDVKEALDGTNIKIGGQNMHWEDSGAFTGEISPLMLKELGIDYVLIGHSERRLYFNETDETVNKKLKAALNHNIRPILCVGESLVERQSGNEEKIVKSQIEKALKDIAASSLEDIVIAYEPIWAIGTGQVASSDDANKMISFIRDTAKALYSEFEAEKLRIQYGGSVKPDNVVELMGKSEIDGALVGGASLKADDFIKLVNY